MKIKTNHEFNLTNQYVFPAVMDDAELCKELIERIFQGKKVVSISDNNGDTDKSVRMDVLFENDREIYDIEIQVADNDNLGKRARYYSSMHDWDLIRRGADPSLLKKSYVIFICTFDQGKLGRAIYTYSGYDMEHDMKLNDGRYIMTLNTTSIGDNISKELQNLFDYIRTDSYEGDDEFLRRLDEKVSKVNREKREAIRYYEEDENSVK